MKRKLTLILAVCAGLAAMPALGADAPKNTQPYSAEYKAAFVEGCLEGGMTKPACECFVRLLEPEWTEAQVAEFGAKVAADPNMDPPPLVKSVVGTCLADPNAKTLAP